MRVRVWNAYASNNSGSYTIVGELPSEQVAQEIADELRAMIAAHTAWYEQKADGASTGAPAGDSPLVAFAKQHGLKWQERLGSDDEWPEYSQDNNPRVLAVGHQVIVHHDYTVTLPPTFGEYFYKRGGRVSHEENHAHHPIVTVASYWWGWSKEEQALRDQQLPQLIAELTRADGVLATQRGYVHAPAWHTARGGFGDPPFTVGVIFDELLDGIAKLRAIGEAHGAKLHLRLHEAPSEEHDPFTHLRPSTPPQPRFDVIVDAVTPYDRKAVTTALFASIGLYEGDALRRLAELPAVVGRGLFEARAQTLLAAITKAGGAARMVRNDS